MPLVFSSGSEFASSSVRFAAHSREHRRVIAANASRSAAASPRSSGRACSRNRTRTSTSLRQS
eukprot:3559002-Rhodomonas_salina.1